MLNKIKCYIELLYRILYKKKIYYIIQSLHEFLTLIHEKLIYFIYLFVLKISLNIFI
jgi:hypothetical protein